jgi:hypothetical protein
VVHKVSDEYSYRKASLALSGDFPDPQALDALIEEALDAFGTDFRYAETMARDAAKVTQRHRTNS